MTAPEKATSQKNKKNSVGWGQEVLDHLCDTDAKRERRRSCGADLREQLLKSGGVTGELAADH